MQIKKYFFPNMIIEQMNKKFTIEIATTNPDMIVMEQLKVATENISNRLAEIDREFSPLRYDSLVSKFQRGDKTPLRFSDDFKVIYNSSILAEQMTDNIYNSSFAGKYDPSKLVTSWAIEQAFDEGLKPLLKHPDIDGIWLSGGGQIKLATKQGSDFRWSVDIKDSEKEDKIVTTYYLQNGVIALMENDNSLRANENTVKQSIIVGHNLVETGVWATISTKTDIKKFMSYVEQYHLTGLLLNREDDFLNFSKGSLVTEKQTL